MREVSTASLLVVFLSAASASQAAVPSSPAEIARTIKADVAMIVAGINAHDVARATAFDAPDIVSMESGRPPSYGLASEREGLGMAFKYNPAWRITLVDETVDVAKAGDMAVYRSTYVEDSVAKDGAPMTHTVNFLEGFKRQSDGAWKVAWSVVCAQSPSHKK